MSGLLTLLGSLLPLIVKAIELWQTSAPKREEKKRDTEPQKLRDEIARGDADAVSRRLDALRSRSLRTANGLREG